MGEALADLLQQRVADAVSLAVIDRLEVVEIDEQEAHAPARAATALQRMRQAIHEEPAVGKSRERIVIGVPFQLRACRGQFGNVFGDSKDEFRNAVFVQQGNNGSAQLARRAIPGDEGDDGLGSQQLARHTGANGIHGAIEVGRNSFAHCLVDDVVPGVTRDALGSLVPDYDTAIVQGADAFRRDEQGKEIDERLQKDPVPLICEFLALACGNVLRDDRDSIMRGDHLLTDPARVDFGEVELVLLVQADARIRDIHVSVEQPAAALDRDDFTQSLPYGGLLREAEGGCAAGIHVVEDKVSDLPRIVALAVQQEARVETRFPQVVVDRGGDDAFARLGRRSRTHGPSGGRQKGSAWREQTICLGLHDTIAFA